MENLELWGKWTIVPKEAQKAITGGRLKGMTDINPMWRLRTLTENFGPVGVGWSYEITKQWTETGANGEVSAFCNINLKIKVDGEWSEPIPGTGGAAYVAKETKGLYTDDEAFKKALTDAISVACKALGMGADVYWKNGSTKYTKPEQEEPPQEEPPQMDYYNGVTPKEYKEKKQQLNTAAGSITDAQMDFLMDAAVRYDKLASSIAKTYGGTQHLSEAQAQKVINQVLEKDRAAQDAGA